VAVSAFARGTVACTGSNSASSAHGDEGFRALAFARTRRTSPGFEEQIKLHITGCPNSCGQHWIGTSESRARKSRPGKMVDAYIFCVGGSVGQIASIARPSVTGARRLMFRRNRALLNAFRDGRDGAERCAHFWPATTMKNWERFSPMNCRSCSSRSAGGKRAARRGGLINEPLSSVVKLDGRA